MRFTWLETPIGALLLAGGEAGLRAIGLPSGSGRVEPEDGWVRDERAFPDARRQLAAYFGGGLREFTVPLDPRGTPFQLRVWEALRGVPYGETISYGALAARLGQPSAGRAVGLANGSNPLPIVVPCHRVIGSNGSLTGYGGGLWAKRFLLDLERRTSGVSQAALFS
jgi:methylated-DNA-[protein]-cysteine S-methyltransferase